MLINEFVKMFNLHDSLIDSLDYFETRKELRLQLDIALWMQEWYTIDMPETKAVSVTFHDIKSFRCPSSAQWDQISILQAEATEESIRFTLMNDMTDEYLEIFIACREITTDLII